MQTFRKHTGVVVPLEKVNVDTDQIIPKQFLKRIERTGFGKFLFYDWRFARFWSREKTSAAALRANTLSGRWRILASAW